MKLQQSKGFTKFFHLYLSLIEIAVLKKKKKKKKKQLREALSPYC